MSKVFAKWPTIFLPLIALTLVLVGCGGALSETITESGSTTVQPLAEKLAAAFTEENPDVEIIVQGGGSSQGFKEVVDGISDIGALSRELKTEEAEQVVEHVIARDGIAIVVHPSTTVSNLTKEQVRNIFAGSITNWSEVGGPNQKIVVISREEGSGTRSAFEEMVMEGELITEDAIIQNSNGFLKTGVSTTPYSIGFLSFGYLDSTVKVLSVDGTPATEENAKNGTYPIVRPLLFVTKEEPEGPVKEFIDFCLSEEGQAIVEEEGYLSVT